MKRNKYVIMSALATIILAGCQDAEYKTIENGLYLKEAQNSKGLMTRKITVDDENVDLTLTAALSSFHSLNVDVEFALDQSLLETYNNATASSYEIPPSQFYEMPSPVMIPAGSISGEVSKLVIKPYTADDGVMYALPLVVKSSSVNALPTSSKFIVLLDKPLIQSVPYMNYRSHLKCEPLDDAGEMKSNWGLALPEWSLEFWVWMDGFDINNQALFDSDEIYIRFGDAMIPFDLMQIKLRGTQVNTVTAFAKETWTHVAFTYDASGLLTIYLNGVKDVALQTKGGAIPVNYLQMICSGASWFENNCKMAQIRFWKKCITPAQIGANRFYSIKPSDDMIGYWRMDEGSGDICYDSSPNGRHAHASAPLTWHSDTRFDGK